MNQKKTEHPANGKGFKKEKETSSSGFRHYNSVKELLKDLEK